MSYQRQFRQNALQGPLLLERYTVLQNRKRKGVKNSATFVINREQ